LSRHFENIKSLAPIALSAIEVIDLAASVLDSAYSLVDIINLAVGVGCAGAVGQKESRLANASSWNQILILIANRLKTSLHYCPGTF
jgi:hypothetical protein